MGALPAITVAIATYNWSGALRCALRSVLSQTVQDFEVLVVGDGCTDDSERVVAAFGDSRLRWHNLERNYGGQWGPNNHANEMARSDWIAYLGHDDIWHPRHLEAILRTARATSPDIVTSVMALYGPAGSGIRGVAGLFPTGSFVSFRDFVPPSALAHSTALTRRGVRWRAHDDLVLPTDVAFLNDASGAGRVESTGELTSFKFNAAWRRDAYRIKSTVEQEALLRRIADEPDFRERELMSLLQSAASEKFHSIAVPAIGGVQRGAFARKNRAYKGVTARFDAAKLIEVSGRMRFRMDTQDMPFEWHQLERHRLHGRFRWTGPQARATIDLPILFDRDLGFRICIIAAVAPLDSLRILFHGEPVPHRLVRRLNRTTIVQGVLPLALKPARYRDFGLTVEVSETRRPFDQDAGADRRWLGVAISWCEVGPASQPRPRGLASILAMGRRRLARWRDQRPRQED